MAQCKYRMLSPRGQTGCFDVLRLRDSRGVDFLWRRVLVDSLKTEGRMDQVEWKLAVGSTDPDNMGSNVPLAVEVTLECPTRP